MLSMTCGWQQMCLDPSAKRWNSNHQTWAKTVDPNHLKLDVASETWEIQRVLRFCFSWSCWCCWCTWSGAAGSRAAGVAGSSWGSWGQVGLLLPSWHIGKGLGPPLPALQQCSLQRRPLLPSPWPTAGASPGYWHPQWSPIAGPPIPAKPTAGGFAPAHGRLTEPSLLCCASAPWLCCASGVRSNLKSVYALKSELIGVMLIDDCCLSLRSIMWSGVKADSAYCLSLTPAQFPAGGGEMWHSKGAMI